MGLRVFHELVEDDTLKTLHLKKKCVCVCGKGQIADVFQVKGTVGGGGGFPLQRPREQLTETIDSWEAHDFKGFPHMSSGPTAFLLLSFKKNALSPSSDLIWASCLALSVKSAIKITPSI